MDKKKERKRRGNRKEGMRKSILVRLHLWLFLFLLSSSAVFYAYRIGNYEKLDIRVFALKSQEQYSIKFPHTIQKA